MSFNDKVILITGASSGIGADAAHHMAKLGAKVAVVGRNERRLNAVADEIKQLGLATPLAIVADVTKDTERIVDETIKQFGKLDVLINNAGISIHDDAVEVDISKFDKLFDTNVRSVIKLTKLCVPHLAKTKGNVVNVSSTGGIKVFKGIMSYCISKAALDQFTKCSALDLAPKGIRVNSINPAAIRTPMFKNYGVPQRVIEQHLADLQNKYPVNRIGKVADTTAAISFLVDNNVASFLTGILLPVDGGSLIAGV